MTTALGRVCAACGITRTKRTMRYHPETLIPYCDNPYICCERHPNSSKHVIERGSELKLIGYDEAQARLKPMLTEAGAGNEEADQIRKMITQPRSVRIEDPQMAKFIITIQNRFAMENFSEAIRYCIQKAMQLDPQPTDEEELPPIESAPDDLTF